LTRGLRERYPAVSKQFTGPDFPMRSIARKLVGTVHRQLELRGERIVRSRLAALQDIDVFHAIFFGGTTHHCPDWKSADHIIHNDAPITVLVSRKGKVAGIVGFEIVGSTLLVRQLQGAPKANFHDGTRAEAYLLECAERVATALRMPTIRVLTPEAAIAYRDAAPETDRPSEIAKLHMRKMYSYPAEAGYRKSFFWRLRRKTHLRRLT
jgi:hypothetical protein